MGKYRRMTAVLLSLLMAATSMAGCNKNSPSSVASNKNVPSYLNSSSFPIVKKPITLTAMVSQTAVQPDWSQMMCWQDYEKKTNVHIQWQCISSTSVTEKRALALASNQLPDIFYRSGLTTAEMLKYGQQGYFVDLSKGMIDNYTPNLKAIMKKYPEVRKAMKTAEGNIYAFPSVNDAWAVQTNPKMFINSKWLSAVNISSPKTTDQFYELLKAFKKTDCNKNGAADEIPFSSTNLNYIVRILRGAWGIGTRGIGNENFDIDAKGQFRFIPTSEGYKQELEYLHKLYSEGLIDKEIFTMDNKTLLAKNEKQQVGVFCFTNVEGVASSNVADFVGIGTCLKGPNGDQLASAANCRVPSVAAMLITKNCKYPEAAARWIDYFYSEKGSELLYSGVEGKTYTKDSTGRCNLTSAYTTIPAGSSFDKVFSQVSAFAGGGLPAFSTTNSFQGAELHAVPLKEANAEKQYAPKECWTPFNFTLDESNQKADLESDLTSYISQKQSEFVQGKTPISDFDKYVAQLNKMGLNDYIKLYKTAYSRYQKE